MISAQQIFSKQLVLIINRKDQMEGDGYYSEHFVTQHDLLRELAIYETRQEDQGHRERLIINITGNDFPKWWREQKYQRMNARLLSISTGCAIFLSLAITCILLLHTYMATC
jgi:hypothetical protein